MELVNLFRAVMLYMSNVKPESQSAENIGGFSESGLTHPPSTLSIINSLPVDTDNAFSNDETEYESYQTTKLVPYDYDCAIPFLPSFVSGKFPDDVEDDDEEESYSDRSDGKERNSEETNQKQTNSKKSDPKQPNPKQSAPKQPDSKHSHAKTTFLIPIHVVHKLPDSELNTLHRYFSCYK